MGDEQGYGEEAWRQSTKNEVEGWPEEVDFGKFGESGEVGKSAEGVASEGSGTEGGGSSAKAREDVDARGGVEQPEMRDDSRGALVVRGDGDGVVSSERGERRDRACATEENVEEKGGDDGAPAGDVRPPGFDRPPRGDLGYDRTVTDAGRHSDDFIMADGSADALFTGRAEVGDEGRRGPRALRGQRNRAAEDLSERDSIDVGDSQAEAECRQPTEEEDGSEAPSDGRASSPRQPRPPEDPDEYAVAIDDISTVDHEYGRWNYAIVEQLMLAGPASEEVLLCVNPRILARVFEEAGLGSIAPEEAEQRFATSVASIYRRRVLKRWARLRVLRRCSSGGLPDCVAFLAGSVLAAFRMQSDEQLSGNAYYRRLADLLECEMQGAYPVGFDPRVFESLWVYSANWLSKEYGRRLAMPRGDVGFRRFVALPLAHAPLRSLDMEKLPGFFAWAGYQPGARPAHERILTDLRRWQRFKNMLTPTGADALNDNRSSAVAAQASAELKAWDGSLYESTRRRSAYVEIQFDVVQRSPVFFYLPRRPAGFPRVFADGERVFEASVEGWYDPVQLRPKDGELLAKGFEWLMNDGDLDYKMRRSGASVIPFTPSSSYSGYLSSRHLLRGVRCSVLCRDNIVHTVKDFLTEVTQDRLNQVSHPTMPNGWSMFRDVSARVAVRAPAGLEPLEVDEDVELIVRGGLRIGRSWAWILGGPPRIVVSGVLNQDDVTVNGASVEVDAKGQLLAGGVFAEPGDYLVEVGRLRRRITIEAPRVSVQNQSELHESPEAERTRTVALPCGSWTLIGRSPDQVRRSKGEFFRGTIATSSFHPSWAVQVGAGPSAVVAVVADPDPPRKLSARGLTGRSRKLVERWSSVVYAAHIRRPQFVWLNGAIRDEKTIGVWRDYVSRAKQIKRRLKKPR